MTVSPETLLLILSAMSPTGVMPYDSDRQHVNFPELKSKRDQRSIALLDSLAALCINQPKKQVLAVSLSLTTDSTTLFIATNYGVAAEVEPHLQAIFTRLRFIRSSLYSPLREGSDETNTPQPNKGPTTAQLEVELLKFIFRFSAPKFRHRLRKRRDRFLTGVIPNMESYAARMEHLWTREEGEDYEKFKGLLRLFKVCFRWADMPSETPLIGEQIARWLGGVALKWRSMVEDEGDTSRLTCWEREIASSSGKPFPLRRYLSKVFSLAYHVESLLKNVAYSFRMGPVLDKLVIKTINPILMDYHVNISKSILHECITQSAGLSETISDETVTDVVLEIMQYLHNDSRFDPAVGTYTVQKSPVHCEVLLLRYHLLNPDIPPFHYFAVSKLCCYPCYALFQAYNRSVRPGEHRYFTKGCHNKVYPFWALPRFGGLKDGQIRSQLAQELFIPELTKLLKNRESVRALSDSTDASGVSTDPVASFSEEIDDAEAAAFELVEEIDNAEAAALEFLERG